jgi:hypothetical protein
LLLAKRDAAVCVNYAARADAAEELVSEIIAAGGRLLRLRPTSPTLAQSRRWSPAPKKSWVQ